MESNFTPLTEEEIIEQTRLQQQAQENMVPTEYSKDQQQEEEPNIVDTVIEQAPAVIEQVQENPELRDGVGQWVEENLTLPVADLLQPGKSREKVSAERDAAVAQGQERSNQIRQAVEDDTSFAGETTKAVIGGIAGSIENIGEAGEFLGDTAAAVGSTVIPGWNREEKDIPWSSSYEAADWDLGTAENKTVVGNFGREMISILINMRQLGAAGVGVGGGGSAASRLGSEALRGGIVDFLQNPEDGNLSNLVQDSWASNLLSKALAHEEDDNQYIRRLKNLVEGGTIGLAVDGIGEVYGAFRAGKKFAAANPEATREQIEEQVISHLFHGTSTQGLQGIQSEGFRASTAAGRGGVGNLLGDGVYFTSNRRMAEDYGPSIISGATDDINIKDITGDELEEIANRYGGFDEYDFIADPQALVKEFGEEYDGVRLIDGGASPSMITGDEIVIFDPKVADQIVEGGETGWHSFSDEELAAVDRVFAEHRAERVRQANIPDGPVTPEWRRTELENRLYDDADGTSYYDPYSTGIEQILPNGSRVEWGVEWSGDTLNIHRGVEVPVIDIAWSVAGADLGGGASGRRLFGFFQDKVASQLEPGTVLRNHPAGDEFAGPRSGAQERRAIENVDDIEIDDWVKQKAKRYFDNVQVIPESERSNWDDIDSYGSSQKYADEKWKALNADQQEEWVRTQYLTSDSYYADARIAGRAPTVHPNIRARLYERAGFGRYDGGAQWAVVRRHPDRRGRYLQPINNPYDTDSLQDAITRARADVVDEGAQARKLENDLNSAKPGELGTMEPHQRAVATSVSSIEDGAVTQAQVSEGFDGVRGGSAHVADEVDFENFQWQEDLHDYISVEAEWIDVDDIVRRLGQQPHEYRVETLRSVARFAASGDPDALNALRFTDDRGLNTVGAGGAVVLDTLIKDTTQQLLDISKTIEDVDIINGDLKTQALSFISRAKALVTMKKEATVQSSFQLQNWKKIPPNVQRSMDKANQYLEKVFADVDEAFRSDDPAQIMKAKDTLKKFARAMQVTKGDPSQVSSFFAAVYRTGIQQLNKAVINSWLSSPVSQMRNIAGNTVVALERPLARIIGHAMQGDWKRMRASASMFDSMNVSVFESLKVARDSLKQSQPITEGSKLLDLTVETTKYIDNLKQVASNPGEKFAANFLGWTNAFINHPWNSWPGRGLQAGDDMFKSLVARMEMRYQAALDADAHGEFGSRDDYYQELLEAKLGPNGEILDHDLLDAAKEATFQQDLEGKMKTIADAINSVPEMKQFVPFLKTPHNVNVFALEHVPGLARFTSEYKQVMQHGTLEQQALMKGREALGFLTVMAGGAAVMQGNVTGNGPQDKELRRLWLMDNEPMSFRTPAGWVSYKSVPGVEVLFSAIADTVEIGEMLPEGEQTKLFSQLGYTLANTFANRAYFQGFIDLSGLFDFSAPTFGDKLTRFIGERTNALGGNAGLRNQLDNALKEGMYEYRNTLEAIKGKLSGGILGDKVPTIDILTGEQMLRGTEGALNSINPFRVAKKNASPLSKLLGELQYELTDGLVNKVDGVDLNPEQQNFIRKEMYDGGKFPRHLKGYLDSSEFTRQYNLWDRNKGTIDHKSRKESDWYKELSFIVGKFRKNAVHRLKNDPELGPELDQQVLNHKAHSAPENPVAGLQNFPLR